MADIYDFTIDPSMFDKVLNKKCHFLVCVNDKDVQTFKPDNLLTFHEFGSDRQLKVKIARLLYFESLKELVDMVGDKNCGFRSGVNLDKLEDEYHSLNKTTTINKYGFVAVEFNLQEE